jgi:chorismate dehydratase
VYGLKHSDVVKHIDFQYDTPANCALRLGSGKADLGIVPVAVVPDFAHRQIISDYCIGADGPVRSVAICSNTPVNQIDTLYLDFESRTSVLLARILLSEYWKHEVKTVSLKTLADIEPDKGAYVLIGDKVFEYEARFEYKYDLAQAWKACTGLPFVFATWTAVSPLPDDFVEKFNSALKYGVQNIPQAAAETATKLSYKESVKYLTENVNYNFDFDKRKALTKFWNMVLRMKDKYRSC